MANIFLSSDSHYSHANILTFKKSDGSLVRDFKSVEEMDETMISRHNSVVGKNDRWYCLGDLAFNNKTLNNILPRLNGIKVLILGNHDELKKHQYMQYFKDIRACHVMDKMILTHIPIHPESLSRWKLNVHGHTHTNNVTRLTENGIMENDPRYYCVCMEQINYTPVPFEIIREYSKQLYQE